MTIKVFEFYRSWSEIPVTVFATGERQANRIYDEWLGAHHPDQPTGQETIRLYNEMWVTARQLLARAAAEGASGIGYCKPGTHHWTIGKPKDEPLGDLALPEPNVQYYRVEADEGDDAKVFATSFEEATTLYCAWHLERWGELPTHFSMRKLSRWQLVGGFVTLRDDMEAEIVGVCAADEDGFYRILPPDFEPIPKKTTH